ncbi:MAG: hypothetical protein V2I33_16075, partial [Kangiellaceae bacterium]|nr:hypothetical protein [Kangiellaceae bacterium]
MSDRSSSWVVLKFGGSSVASVEHWQTILQQVILQQNAGNRVLLVLSALKNVSNSLEALLHQAKAGVHQSALVHLKELHLGFASQLGVELSVPFDRMFHALLSHCQKIHQQQIIEPHDHA